MSDYSGVKIWRTGGNMINGRLRALINSALTLSKIFSHQSSHMYLKLYGRNSGGQSQQLLRFEQRYLVPNFPSTNYRLLD